MKSSIAVLSPRLLRDSLNLLFELSRFRSMATGVHTVAALEVRLAH